jgi:hypothetical protein
VSSRNNPASEDVRVNPLAFVGLHSSVEERSHFPRQTWALALHRATMNPAKAPFCESVTPMLGQSAIRLSIQMGLSERRSASLSGTAARSSDQNVVRRDLERLSVRSLKEETARAPALTLFLQQGRMALHVKPVKVTEFSLDQSR